MSRSGLFITREESHCTLSIILDILKSYSDRSSHSLHQLTTSTRPSLKLVFNIILMSTLKCSNK
jgi:hypothetical protein